VLGFDIDAKDMAKQRIAGSNTSFENVSTDELEAHGVIDEPPEPAVIPPENASSAPPEEASGHTVTYPYTFTDLENTINSAFNLKDWLETTVGFDDVRVVYSGQGAHVYAFKDDPAYKLTMQSRKFLADSYIKEQLNIPLDAGVTWDESRVMRLPFSLHGDVNRVVREITSPSFDFRTANKTSPGALDPNTDNNSAG